MIPRCARPISAADLHGSGAGRAARFALLWLIGFQLRSVVLAVPPVLPLIRSDLHLSFSAAGALTAIPVLGLGAAAVPGALLVARFGPRTVAGLATLGLGVAALLRAAPPLPWSLFLFTAVLALCVAVAQPACAVVLRLWFRDHVQAASSGYAAALGIGALAGGSLTLHLLGPGGWRGTFVLWGALALAAGLAWLILAPGRQVPHTAAPSHLGALARTRAVWHMAALFGMQSLVYYAASTWIPFLLHGAASISLVLAALNLSNIPVAVILATWRWPWAASRRFYAGAATAVVVGITGLLLLPALSFVWVLLAGTGIACCFTGASAAPAVFARRDAEVAGFSAIELALGYALSFVGPLLGGWLLDLTHDPRAPFVPVLVAAVILVALGATLPKPHSAVTFPQRVDD